MKETVEQLKKDIADAKNRRAEATKDIKQIEKDMSEFNNNKDSKLAELQSSLDALKKSLNKNSGSVKTLQKELQVSRLESEQAGSDLSAAEEQLAEVDSTIKAQLEEIESLKKEQSRIKVSQQKIAISPKFVANRRRMPTTSPRLNWKKNRLSLQVLMTSYEISRRLFVLRGHVSRKRAWRFKNSGINLRSCTKTSRRQHRWSLIWRMSMNGLKKRRTSLVVQTPRMILTAKTSVNAGQLCAI